MKGHKLERLWDCLGLMGARSMLRIWGLRVDGRALSNPLAVGGGGQRQVDDELALVTYVEETPGFHVARPVLAWVYVEHGRLKDYPYRRFVEASGWHGWDRKVRGHLCPLEPRKPLVLESRLQAAMRHEQADVLVRASMHGGITDAKLAGMLMLGFARTLQKRMVEEPFRVPRAVVAEMSSEDAAAFGSAKGEREFPDRWRRRA